MLTNLLSPPCSSDPLQGWDKTYCLQFVNKDFDVIHFFGDKTFQVREETHPRSLAFDSFHSDCSAMHPHTPTTSTHQPPPPDHIDQPINQGGNDYEIFTSDETIGHTVTSPDDTVKLCKELFMS